MKQHSALVSSNLAHPVYLVAVTNERIFFLDGKPVEFLRHTRILGM